MCTYNRYLIVLLTSLLTFSTIAHADVHNCNGVWTDKPCDAPNIAKLNQPTTNKSEQAVLAAKDKARKRYLVQELAIKKNNAQKNYDITVSTTAIENYCLKEATPLLDCEEKINQINTQIDERSASMETTRAQKRSIELQDELNRRRAADAENSVTVIQQPDYGYDYYYTPTPLPNLPQIIINNNQTQINVTGNGAPSRPGRPRLPPPPPIRKGSAAQWGTGQ